MGRLKPALSAADVLHRRRLRFRGDPRARNHVAGLISGRRAPPSDSQLPAAQTISAAAKNEAPNVQTPFHCHRLHAKPARNVPSAPPTKYVTMKTVLIRLRASGINLYTRV